MKKSKLIYAIGLVAAASIGAASGIMLKDQVEYRYHLNVPVTAEVPGFGSYYLEERIEENLGIVTLKSVESESEYKLSFANEVFLAVKDYGQLKAEDRTKYGIERLAQRYADTFWKALTPEQKTQYTQDGWKTLGPELKKEMAKDFAKEYVQSFLE